MGIIMFAMHYNGCCMIFFEKNAEKITFFSIDFAKSFESELKNNKRQKKEQKYAY